MYAGAFFSAGVLQPARGNGGRHAELEGDERVAEFSVPLNSSWSICLSRSAIQVLGEESPVNDDEK